MVRRVMVVMAIPADVNVVGAAGQATQEEPKAQSGNDKTPDQTKEDLHSGRNRLRKEEEKADSHDKDRSGVRQRRYHSQHQGMHDRAALADQVGGHQRFAVARRQGVSGTKGCG